MTVIDWLLDGDPAICWQVMRDLTHEPADCIAAERARVATEGWGARLLAPQAPDGHHSCDQGPAAPRHTLFNNLPRVEDARRYRDGRAARVRRAGRRLPRAAA